MCVAPYHSALINRWAPGLFFEYADGTFEPVYEAGEAFSRASVQEAWMTAQSTTTSTPSTRRPSSRPTSA